VVAPIVQLYDHTFRVSPAVAAVYGHLHIHVPHSTEYDGVRLEEVSLGNPQEWGRRGSVAAPMRRFLRHGR